VHSQGYIRSEKSKHEEHKLVVACAQNRILDYLVEAGYSDDSRRVQKLTLRSLRLISVCRWYAIMVVGIRKGVKIELFSFSPMFLRFCRHDSIAWSSSCIVDSECVFPSFSINLRD
jgi:hypothetical protein